MSVKCPLPVTRRDPNEKEPPVGLDRWNKIVVLAPNSHIASLVERQYRDMPWMKVIFPGQCLAGFRFAMVLASSDTYNDVVKFGTENVQRWWREVVMARLTLNAQIIVTP